MFYDARAENAKIDEALAKIEAMSTKVSGPRDEHDALVDAIKVLAEAVKMQSVFWEDTMGNSRMSAMSANQPRGLS